MRMLALMVVGALLCGNVLAGDKAPYSLSFFSVVPPATWHVETDGERRLLASGSGAESPPLLILEACRHSRDSNCPSRCDLSSIERSGVVANMHLAFAPVPRRDEYVEYSASDQQVLADGKVFAAVRILCGSAGFVYAALADIDSHQASEAQMTAVIDSIRWTK